MVRWNKSEYDQGYKAFPNNPAVLGNTLVISPSTCTVIAQAAVKLSDRRPRCLFPADLGPGRHLDTACAF